MATLFDPSGTLTLRVASAAPGFVPAYPETQDPWQDLTGGTLVDPVLDQQYRNRADDYFRRVLHWQRPPSP